MCGIIGFVDSQKNRSSLWEWAGITIAHRGEDSYGAILYGDTIQTIKRLDLESTPKGQYYDKKRKRFMSYPATTGIMEDLENLPLADFVLFHNRAASVGGVTVDLAHPITKANTYNISVIHNGTKKSLTSTFPKFGKSDTEVMATFLSYHFEDDVLTDEVLNGAGVVFGVNHDTKQVLVHIDGNRPLFVHEDKQIFASEPLFGGKWQLVKNHTKMYQSFEDFIENSPKYDAIEVEDKDLSYPVKCAVCNRTHYVNDDGVCFKCASEGKKPTYTARYYGSGTYYYYGGDDWYGGNKDYFPVGATVYYYSTISNKWEIGNIVKKEGNNRYQIEAPDGLLKIFDKDRIKPIPALYLDKNKKYLFSDSDNWLELKFLGENTNSYNKNKYPYIVKSQYGATTYYKFVSLDYRDIEKIQKKLDKTQRKEAV